MTGYRPLERYGLIGNLEACALVGDDGSIDWCCFPHLASPSVFAKIPDAEEGGHFSIRPTDEHESSQSYVDRTNVLETTFDTNSGAVTITTFMPVFGVEDDDVPKQTIFRRVSCTSGSLSVDVAFRPRFDHARAETAVGVIDGGVLSTADVPRGDSAGTAEEKAFLSGDLDWAEGRAKLRRRSTSTRATRTGSSSVTANRRRSPTT